MAPKLKTLIISICLLFLLGTHAEANALFREYANLVAKKVESLEHKDPDLLKKLSILWVQKCENSGQESCFLTEADLYPDGSSENILLFRGEAKRNKFPAVSSLFRYVLADEYLCDGFCSFESLIFKLDSMLRDLARSESFATDEYVSVRFYENGGQWSEDGMDENDNYKSLPLTKPKAGELLPSPLSLMANTHINEGGVGIATTANGLVNFDPFVSFSADPRIALKFTHDHRRPSKEAGRFIIISAPRSAANPSVCEGRLSSAGSLMNILPCVSYMADDYHHELEVDSVFAVAPEAIKDVIIP